MQKAFALMSVRPGDGDGKPMHYFRTVCRLASLVAYGLSLFILDHVHPIAAKAYDDLCSSQGTTFGAAHSVREFVIAAIIFAVPLPGTQQCPDRNEPDHRIGNDLGCQSTFTYGEEYPI
jgi:hypothetical protein